MWCTPPLQPWKVKRRRGTGGGGAGRAAHAPRPASYSVVRVGGAWGMPVRRRAKKTQAQRRRGAAAQCVAPAAEIRCGAASRGGNQRPICAHANHLKKAKSRIVWGHCFVAQAVWANIIWSSARRRHDADTLRGACGLTLTVHAGRNHAHAQPLAEKKTAQQKRKRAHKIKGAQLGGKRLHCARKRSGMRVTRISTV